jgi:SAM-dependent methyltransferase
MSTPRDTPAADPSSRPGYADYRDMQQLTASHARGFAGQVLSTCAPDLSRPVGELDVLDVGCGYGHASAVLAETCRSVVGIEPTSELHEAATRSADGVPNLEFRHCGVEGLDDVARFDLVVLDNVFEHLPDQVDALARIDRALRPGGVVYLLMPNLLWPLEVHYRLPFLGWLPLPLANHYLRMSGRGQDYTDASYAVTLWGLRQALRTRPDWTWRLSLPADPNATHAGTPWHYRTGMAALRRAPALWAVSKSFLVVAKKQP